MILHFAPDVVNLAFRDDVAIAHQDDPIRDAIDFLKNVAGDDHVHAVLAQSLEQRDRFRARHRIKTVERLVQHDHRRMMAIACASRIRCRMPLL